MEKVNKYCIKSLQLVLLGNKPRKRNKQQNSARLVKQQCKNLFNKTCLNVLIAVDARWRRAEPSKKRGNKIARDQGTRTGIGSDNK